MAKKKKGETQKRQDEVKKLERDAEKLEDGIENLEDQLEKLEDKKSGPGVQKLQDEVKKLGRGAKKVQEGIEDLAGELEESEDQEKPKPPRRAKRIAILNDQHQEKTMDTIHLGNERVYTAEGRDAQNNPAPLLEGDVPAYTVLPDGVCSLFPTSDGMSCEVVAVAAGDCTVTVTGKDVKGGVVTGSIDINVPAAEPPLATRIELTGGPEIPV